MSLPEVTRGNWKAIGVPSYRRAQSTVKPYLQLSSVDPKPIGLQKVDGVRHIISHVTMGYTSPTRNSHLKSPSHDSTALYGLCYIFSPDTRGRNRPHLKPVSGKMDHTQWSLMALKKEKRSTYYQGAVFQPFFFYYLTDLSIRNSCRWFFNNSL